MVHSQQMTTGPSGAQTTACVAVVNPAGAGGRARRMWSAAAPAARDELAKHGYQLIERFTAGPGDGQQLAAAAAQSGAAVVLAVGGDGTLHEVVNGLIQASQSQQQPELRLPLLQQQQQQDPGSPPALAVLPLGTGCDFARSFGWRTGDVASACTRVTSGKRTALDIGRVVLHRKQGCRCCCTAAAADHDAKSAKHCNTSAHDSQTPTAPGSMDSGKVGLIVPNPQQQQQQQQQADHLEPVAGQHASITEVAESKTCYFANIMSCGVGAEANQIAGRLKALGGFAYIVGSALALMMYKQRALQVHICDQHHGECSSTNNPNLGATSHTLEDLTALVIGNCSFWGAGLKVLPEAESSDGWLDAVALQGLGLWDFLTKAHRLRSGNYQGVAGVNGLPRFRAMHICSTSASLSSVYPLHVEVEKQYSGDDPVPVATASRRVSSHKCVCPCWEIDGEFQGSWCAAEVTVLPGALRVCV